MERLMILEIPEGRLAEIFDRLHKAEKEIDQCYNELRYLGVVHIKKASSAKDDALEKAAEAIEKAAERRVPY